MQQDERPLTTSDLAAGGDRGDDTAPPSGAAMQPGEAARGAGAETTTGPRGDATAMQVESRPATTATEERDTAGADSETGAQDDAEGGGTTDLTGHRADAEQPQVLFAEDDTGRFRSRWEEIQADFVDDPRGSVERADRLVAEVMQHLASTFSRMRSDLEAQWYSGGDAGTEDLRVALRRYRTFFELLLRR